VGRSSTAHPSANVVNRDENEIHLKPRFIGIDRSASRGRDASWRYADVPLYDYQCEAGHRYEKRESFGAPAQQPCEKCGKPAQRLLSAPPILFKGSGWYVTDSKRTLRTGVDSPASSTETASDLPGSDDGGSSNGTSETATAKKKTKSGASKKTSAKSSTASSDD
jgi:putative FmdB family regulatory protein